MKPFIYSLLWFLLAPASNAQVAGHFEEPIPTPLRIVSLADSIPHSFNEDSAIVASMSNPDTVIRPGKSTTVALFASMILPGAGQIYNTSYWKVPVIWGLEYYFYSVYKSQNQLYKDNKKLYEEALDSLAAGGNGSTFGLNAPIYKHFRDFYQGQRDTFGWYIAIAYIVNLLDAYVDASLYNFEVSPNLQPTNGFRASFQIHF